jgi:hypothetical protein
MPETSPTPDAVELVQRGAEAASQGGIDGWLAPLAVCVRQGRPWGSDGFVEFRYAPVSTWADGLIAQQTNYSYIDQARVPAERLAGERA